jgi:biopolymer transport protein ExbB
MTAIGLAVAVPAVMAYNWLGRRNKQIQADLNGFTADLHDSIVTGARVAVPQSAPAAAPKK